MKQREQTISDDEKADYTLSFELDEETQSTLLSSEPDENELDSQWTEISPRDSSRPAKFRLLRFNPSGQVLLASNAMGFAVVRCSPFETVCRKGKPSNTRLSIELPGTGIVELLGMTSLAVVTGSGEDPEFSSRSLKILNLNSGKSICRMQFSSTVLNVRLMPSRMIVVLLEKIIILDLPSLSKRCAIDTPENPLGLVCVIALAEDDVLMAFPGSKRGTVHLYDGKRLKLVCKVNAHNSALQSFAFSRDGINLATSSRKGTVVKVFCCRTGKLLKTLKRGTNTAKIVSISFNTTGTYLCVSSDRDTVHIFSLTSKKTRMSLKSQGTKHLRNLMPSTIHKYVDQKRGTSSIRIKEYLSSGTLTASFLEDDRIAVVSESGVLYLYQLDVDSMEPQFLSEQSITL